jgi:uncharacterized iron-regulated membrane protein
VTVRSFRQTVQTIHLWTGLILAVPLILIGLSGSALLVQREILRLSIPTASTAGESQPVSRIFAAARTAMPSDARMNALELPQSRGAPAAVQFALRGRPARIVNVYIDPVSLKVLGTANVVRRGPMAQKLVNIHEYLMMPGRFGLPFVGWTAVAMTFMGFSGLILWWPKGSWLSGFLVRRGARGLRLHLDLHNAMGIWGLVIFLCLSVSGIYLVFPQTISTAVRSIIPPAANRTDPPLPHISPLPAIDADRALALAAFAVPDARVTGVQLPGAIVKSFVVQMVPAGFTPAVPPITVGVDPQTANLIIDDPRNYPPGDKIMNLLYAMHFSLGLGWVWTVLVFLSGLLPLFFAVTGVTIWTLKRRAKLAPE